MTLTLLAAAACSSANSTGSPTSSPSATDSAVASGPPETQTSIKLGAVGGLAITLTYPISVALDEGFFSKHKLDVTVITESGDTSGCSNLIAGATQIDECAVNRQLAVNAKGADIIQFDTELSVPMPFGLLVKKGTTWADLKGKQVTLGSATDPAAYFLQEMAKQGGTLKLSDFKMTYLASTGSRFAALQSGQVEAAMLAIPGWQDAQAQGYELLASTLADPALSAEHLSGGGMTTQASWASTHQGVVLQYMRAVQDAIRWMNDPSNKTAVLASLTKTYKLASASIAESVYQSLIGDHVFNESLCSVDSAQEGSIQAAISVGAVPVGSYKPEDTAPNTYANLLNGNPCPQ